MTVRVDHADMREWLAAYDGPLFDSCVTDPPYELGFMGKGWDKTGVANRPETWRAVFDALKPGAHLVAFSGTRTYHRMVCAIEDAGFEVRDQLAWVYGSGFPKSLDVSKAIDKAAGNVCELTRGGVVQRDGYGDDWDTGSSATRPRFDMPASFDAARWQGFGTALKPAWEPICLARKPLVGTVAANVLAHGTGALNIDGCRVGSTRAVPASHSKSASAIGATGISGKRLASELDPNIGRWPANICHDGSDEVMAGFPQTASGSLNQASVKAADRIYGGGFGNGKRNPRQFEANSGSAARFFYSAKAGPLDRLGSKHPTVKPIALMRWLCRLVTPPGGHILDPFAGSGTTGIAAMLEGFDCTLLELEAEHVADIERKLEHVRNGGAVKTAERGIGLFEAAA